VVAGAAAAVAGVAAAGAAVASAKSGSGEDQQMEKVGESQPVTVAEEVTVVEQPPPDVVRTDVLVDESGTADYSTPPSTEGVEAATRRPDDDPMIGGGSR